MVSKNLTLKNPQGFCMQSALVFASNMSEFRSKVTIKFKDGDYNAKSLLNIVAACIKCGSEFELVCEGEDENLAMKKAEMLIENNL